MRATRTLAAVIAVMLFFSMGGSALAAKDPVVLVHGWGMNCVLTFGVMKYKLENDGYQTFCLDFSNPIGSNYQNARELSAKVDAVLAKTGAPKVDIVEHSMGGLSSRYYIKNMGGASKVRDIVELGSPNHGTWLALVAFGISPGAYEMLPGSSFLNALNSGDETPGPTRWTSIRSVCDEAMYPKDSPILGGASNKKVWWCVGHIGLTLDPWVYGWVKDGLNGKGTN
ncbi:MAG: triacylglycerol lipase [Euryarchaeota archaeon]|nr:triacylglycerol lipase [Euryarchaeota archaeon]